MVLYLLPNLLDLTGSWNQFLPATVQDILAEVDGLIAESTPGARRYLSRFKTKKKAHEMPIGVIPEKQDLSEIDFLLEPLLKGEVWGLISDAGLPCVADPGYLIVKRAQEKGIKIEAISGPSSLMMAIELSGLSGQNFWFHGYLPKEEKERQKALFSHLQQKGVLHLYIETPYRIESLFQELLASLLPTDVFGIACDLTMPTQEVRVLTVREWKESEMVNLQRRQCVFLIQRS